MKIEDEMRLVGKFARRMAKKTGNPFPELFQEGFIGLLQAKKNYDPAKGSESGYYAYRINGSMLDYLREICPLSRSQMKKKIPVPKFVPVEDAKLSVDDSFCEKTELRDMVGWCLRGMNHKERVVILARYWHEKEFSEVAKTLGMTAAGCSWIHRKALAKMQDRLLF